MKSRRTRRTDFTFGPFRRWAASLAVWTILIGAVSAPTASAGLVEKTTDTVGSTVKSVQDTVKSVQDTATNLPPLPSTSPPSTPPPAPPPAAVAPAPPPRGPAKLPSKDSPAIPPQPSADSTGLPAADGVTDGAEGAVGSVRSAGNEAAAGVTAPERSDAGTVGAVSPQRTDRGASESSRTASGPAVAVRAAEVAALQRWLARVWPAITLGGGETNGAGVVEAIAGDLFRPALAALTGVLLTSSPVLPLSADQLALDGRQGVAGASRSAPDDPPLVPADGDGGGIVYLIAIAGLLGLLGFTVWREFRVALHPRLR